MSAPSRQLDLGAASDHAIDTPGSDHHVMPTTLYLPAAGGVDHDEIAVRALIAIIDYTPGQRGSWDCPPCPPEHAIEIRDEYGEARPEWQSRLTRTMLDRLHDAAGHDWQAAVDDELGQAALDRIDAAHEDAVRGVRIGGVWV